MTDNVVVLPRRDGTMIAMSLQDDIDYWRRRAQRSKTDAWLIAIGVAYGLTLAKEEHAEEIACLALYFSLDEQPPEERR